MMADITKVKVSLNSGIAVIVSADDGGAVAINDGNSELSIINASAQIIATFNKSAVAYWTTDLAEVS